MQITCTSAITAAQVQFILRKHGITITSQFGPSIGDPTVRVMVNQVIDKAQDTRIRQDINGIPGATIGESPHTTP